MLVVALTLGGGTSVQNYRIVTNRATHLASKCVARLVALSNNNALCEVPRFRRKYLSLTVLSTCLASL